MAAAPRRTARSYADISSAQASASLRRGLEQDIWDSASVRHAFARLALDYQKRDNVFRLTLGNGRCMLLQCDTSEQAATWVRTINDIAATTSAPPLPAPVTSARSGFRPPVLPESKSTETLEEQRARYKTQSVKLARDLITLREEEGEYRAGGKQTTAYFEAKLAYMEYETKRLQTYLRVIEQKLGEDVPSNAGSRRKYRFRGSTRNSTNGSDSQRLSLSFVSGYAHSAAESDQVSWV
eukprot:m.69678 g.69678  ORF g.69678 m.69678 type:complete len:238 (-) comp14140_c0_seq2:32-745(-)